MRNPSVVLANGIHRCATADPQNHRVEARIISRRNGTGNPLREYLNLKVCQNQGPQPTTQGADRSRRSDPTQMSAADLRASAEEIHDALITVDSHDNIPLDFATESVDPLNAARQVSLEKMRAGGLDVGFFIVFVGQTEQTPESYTNIEPAHTGIRRMLNYLQRHEPDEVHHRAMMLWAGKYYEDLVSAEERQRWIDELLKLQKASGGWASGDLGRWRQRAPETGGYSHLDPELVEREFPPVMVDPNGDGYGTGFVQYALLQAGVPASHDQMQKGLAWLKSNQQADGKWFTNSLRNQSDTSNFLTHTGTTFALMVLAEMM